MSIIRSLGRPAPRHIAMGGGAITLRVDTDLVDEIIAEKAKLREQARRRQFLESISA